MPLADFLSHFQELPPLGGEEAMCRANFSRWYDSFPENFANLGKNVYSARESEIFVWWRIDFL
ncbi:MAG: hypothetical protein ACLFQP_04270 [Halothece sp.]